MASKFPGKFSVRFLISGNLDKIFRFLKFSRKIITSPPSYFSIENSLFKNIFDSFCQLIFKIFVTHFTTDLVLNIVRKIFCLPLSRKSIISCQKQHIRIANRSYFCNAINLQYKKESCENSLPHNYYYPQKVREGNLIATQMNRSAVFSKLIKIQLVIVFVTLWVQAMSITSKVVFFYTTNYRLA